MPHISPLISARPSNPWMHAVLRFGCDRYSPNCCANRLVDAPVSTIASPNMHLLDDLVIGGTSLRVATIGVRFVVRIGLATIAVLVIRPVGNSKFPTVGSYDRGCPRVPENDERYEHGVVLSRCSLA